MIDIWNLLCYAYCFVFSIPQKFHLSKFPDIEESQFEMGGGKDENLKGTESFTNNIDTIYLKLKTKATESLLRGLICEFRYIAEDLTDIKFRQSKYIWLICFKQCSTCARYVQHMLCCYKTIIEGVSWVFFFLILSIIIKKTLTKDIIY